MCVIGPYFVCVVVSEALFSVSVGYFWWVEVGGALFWMGGGEWGWVGHYFGWVMVNARSNVR